MLGGVRPAEEPPSRLPSRARSAPPMMLCGSSITLGRLVKVEASSRGVSLISLGGEEEEEEEEEEEGGEKGDRTRGGKTEMVDLLQWAGEEESPSPGETLPAASYPLSVIHVHLLLPTPLPLPSYCARDRGRHRAAALEEHQQQQC